MSGLDLTRVAPQQVRPGAETLIGQVTASAGSRVTVTIAELSVEMPCLRSYVSPAVDDVVLVLKNGRAMYCLGALNATPVAPPTPTGTPSDGTPAPAPVNRTTVFRPTTVGTWAIGLGSWSHSDAAAQGDWGVSTGQWWGAAYYGSGPVGLKTKTAVSATVKIKRTQGGSPGPQRPTLTLLTGKRRPGGFPTNSASILGPPISVGQALQVVLPVAWATALMAGTAGGIGIGVPATSPQLALAGPSTWSPAFQLSITYHQ